MGFFGFYPCGELYFFPWELYREKSENQVAVRVFFCFVGIVFILIFL